MEGFSFMRLFDSITENDKIKVYKYCGDKPHDYDFILTNKGYTFGGFNVEDNEIETFWCYKHNLHKEKYELIKTYKLEKEFLWLPDFLIELFKRIHKDFPEEFV